MVPHMIRRFIATAFATASLFAGSTADAQVLLSNGPRLCCGEYINPGQQFGHLISVASNTTVTQFGFWGRFNTQQTTVTRLSILSGDGSTQLYSQAKTIGFGFEQTLVLTDPFSVNLLAGQSYYFVFGVAGLGLDLNIDSYAQGLTQNGLTLGNRISRFSWTDNSPFPGLGTDGVIGLQIRGTSTVPEPGTYVLLATGLAALFVVRRRRRA